MADGSRNGNGLAFISGQVAWPADGKPTHATLVEQTELVIANLKAALEAVGATPHDMILLKTYVVDLSPECMSGFCLTRHHAQRRRSVQYAVAAAQP